MHQYIDTDTCIQAYEVILHYSHFGNDCHFCNLNKNLKSWSSDCFSAWRIDMAIIQNATIQNTMIQNAKLQRFLQCWVQSYFPSLKKMTIIVRWQKVKEHWNQCWCDIFYADTYTHTCIGIRTGLAKYTCRDCHGKDPCLYVSVYIHFLNVWESVVAREICR